MSADPSAAIRADDFTVLPPAEIAEHAKELGWTVESRVYKAALTGSFIVFPSSMMLAIHREVMDTSISEGACQRRGDTLLPNRRVPKPKPAAASAWEEWENAFIAGPDQPSHWEQFNRWVAAREKAAVEARGKLDYQQGFADGQHVAENKNRLREKIINAAARLAPKPDAGRAEGAKCPKCGKPGEKWQCTMPTEWWCDTEGCPMEWFTVPTPKPRRAPEVVAEEVVKVWASERSHYHQDYPALKGHIAAAVRDDRGEA